MLAGESGSFVESAAIPGSNGRQGAAVMHCEETQVSSVELVLPQHGNHHQLVTFGGQVSPLTINTESTYNTNLFMSSQSMGCVTDLVSVLVSIYTGIFNSVP